MIGETALLAMRRTSRIERSATRVAKQKTAKTPAATTARTQVVEAISPTIVAAWKNICIRLSTSMLSLMSTVFRSEVKRERTRPEGVLSYQPSGA